MLCTKQFLCRFDGFFLAGAGRDKELPDIDMRVVNNNKRDLMLKSSCLTKSQNVRLSFVVFTGPAKVRVFVC